MINRDFPNHDVKENVKAGWDNVLIKGVLFLNDHVTQFMVWEVPSSLNILFDVMVWKIPVYHPAFVVKFYRVNLESLITLLIDS